MNCDITESKIIKYFSSLKKAKKLGSSYLFLGRDFESVKIIFRMLICKEDVPCGICWDCLHCDSLSHPDLRVIDPQPTSIKIDQIRQAQAFLSLKSFRANVKILLVKEADMLGNDAANAFLKTLEEPPANSFIALLSSSAETLLPTIVSRCRKIYLPSLDVNESDNFLQLRDFLEGEWIKFKDRVEFGLFLKTFIYLLRDSIVLKSSPGALRFQRSDNERIIENSYSLKERVDILELLLKMHKVHESINQNLCLELIKSKLEDTN